MNGRMSRYSDKEMKTIMKTLEECGGNCCKTSRALKVLGITINPQLVNYYQTKAKKKA